LIAIIDYGSGNLRSVYNAFRFLGQEVRVCQSPEELVRADKIVLPGVGSSKDAMEGLESRGLTGPLVDQLGKGKPFLGICLGLQLLFERSEESGGCDCLGLVKGQVRLFPGGGGRKVPQIGWNTVEAAGGACPLFRGIQSGSYFYFVHSYYCDCGQEGNISGRTEYGVNYASAIWKENIFAVQFHPERSQSNGLKILENFTEL